MQKRTNFLEPSSMSGQLPLGLSENIRSINPWWRNEPLADLPNFRRWAFRRLEHLLDKGMAPATVLRGPRRVGKTILLKQIIQDLLQKGVSPDHILYVPFDELPSLGGIQEPVLAVSRWYEKEILGISFNAAAKKGKPIYVFFDEVQNLASWAPQVKSLVDNHPIRVLITGSSSLRIEAGRDSLAGRITSVDLGPLLLREIAGLRFGGIVAPFWGENGLDAITTREFWIKAKERAKQEMQPRAQAFAAFSERGAYPIAHERADISWPEVSDYLNETVIQRAIQHDLRMGPRGQKRDEKLLEELFRLCCRYAGQAPGQRMFVPEIHQALSGNISWNRMLNYLRFLDGTLLIRLIKPLELRLKKQKSPPKICLCDHALRASWLQEVVPLDPAGLSRNPHLTDLAGHLAESALGYFLASIPNLDAAYFPARAVEPEVDFVLTVGTRRIPIEVKYRQRLDAHQDTLGLRAFLEKSVYNAPFGLLVTLEDDVEVLDPRVIPISLSALLWLK